MGSAGGASPGLGRVWLGARGPVLPLDFQRGFSHITGNRPLLPAGA